MTRLATLLLVAPLALLAACGDNHVDTAAVVTSPSTTGATATAAPAPTLATATRETTVAAHVVVLRDVSDGGCVVLGPNCPTYTVYLDGTVEIGRTDTDQLAEITGTVPTQAVAAWLQVAEHTDFVALAVAAGPGSCQSCVDGTDRVLTLTLPGVSDAVRIDSTVEHFDESQPFFAALEELMVQVRAVGTLTVRQG